MKQCSLYHLCALLLVLSVSMSGCRSTRTATSGAEASGFLSSKVLLTVPHGNATLTVNGTMKLKQGEVMQLSLLMPILRTEVARIELSPDELLLVDRMGKRYVRTTRSELKAYLPRKADFAHLEKMLYKASKPGAKRTLTAIELGIPKLEKGAVELTDFNHDPFKLQRFQITQKYRQVPLEELLELLLSL